jgi:hypothetical protein
MPGTPAHDHRISPTRLLEMLSDRFGAFEAIANSSIKLARVAPEEELAMEGLVAECIMPPAGQQHASTTVPLKAIKRLPP